MRSACTREILDHWYWITMLLDRAVSGGWNAVVIDHIDYKGLFVA